MTQAIRGLGGVGKTELAAQYAWRERKRYIGGVFFVSADTNSTLDLLQRMARALGQHELVKEADVEVLRDALHRWLDARRGRFWFRFCSGRGN